MAHDHNHKHSASKNITVAFWINLSFSIFELVGGLLTNSVAILSDALHDFGDSVSLGLSWYFQKKSGKKRDAKYSYGYRRFSLLGAVINSVILLLGSIYVISESIDRIITPQQSNAKGMFLMAIFGVVVNGWAMLRLRRGSSLNERTVSLHMLEDVLGWAAVGVGSIVMMFFDVPVLDPIMSLAIAIYILSNIYRNLSDTLRVVLQGTPLNVDLEQIENEVKSIEGVKSIHDLHVWTMDGEYNVLTVHVVATESEDLKNRIRQKLKDLSIDHSTIELESEEEPCEFTEDCSQ